MRDSLANPSTDSREAIVHVLRESDRLFQDGTSLPLLLLIVSPIPSLLLFLVLFNRFLPICPVILLPFPGNCDSTVKQPREAVLDSALLAYTTKLVGEQVERMVSGFRSYDPATFIAVMKQYLDSKAGVGELAHRARAYSLVTDDMTCMLGPMDVEIKARKAREVRKKDDIKESERPDDYDELEADNRNESTKRVEVLHNNLQDMNFWKFIYDGTDGKGFGRTVENLFYSSFLVRDGHSGLEVRQVDQPYIVPKEAPSEQDYVDRKVNKHQCVVQFDYKMWQALRDKLSGATYLPEPIAVARDPNRSSASSSTTSKTSSSSTTTSAPSTSTNRKTSATVVSPTNAKKRGRVASLPAEEEEVVDMMVSQVEATPEERMPKPKRAKVKGEYSGVP